MWSRWVAARCGSSRALIGCGTQSLAEERALKTAVRKTASAWTSKARSRAWRSWATKSSRRADRNDGSASAWARRPATSDWQTTTFVVAQSRWPTCGDRKWPGRNSPCSLPLWCRRLACVFLGRRDACITRLSARFLHGPNRPRSLAKPPEKGYNDRCGAGQARHTLAENRSWRSDSTGDNSSREPPHSAVCWGRTTSWRPILLRRWPNPLRTRLNRSSRSAMPRAFIPAGSCGCTIRRSSIGRAPATAIGMRATTSSRSASTKCCGRPSPHSPARRNPVGRGTSSFGTSTRPAAAATSAISRAKKSSSSRTGSA